MTVYDAAWYDTVLVEDGSPAMEPLESSPWLTTYTELARMIDPCEEVVDLGCGTGRFIELLYRREHYAQVTGIDFSQAALDEAERYCRPTHHEAVPPVFVCQDLDEWEPDGDRAGNTVYVCSEVLEHLEDDVDLVRRVPPGHRLLLTVPNFHSESHLRRFTHVGQAFERYGLELDFRRWVMVGSDRQGIHVYETRRRGTAW